MRYDDPRDMRHTTPLTYPVSRYGGGQADIKLPDTRNTPQVFWTHDHHSYIICEVDGGLFKAEDGKVVELYSINGIGEIRWRVDSDSFLQSPGEREAIAYFRLTPWED